MELFAGESLEHWLQSRRAAHAAAVDRLRREESAAPQIDVQDYEVAAVKVGTPEPIATAEADVVSFMLTIPVSGEVGLLALRPEGFHVEAIELVAGVGAASTELPQGTVDARQIVLRRDADPTDEDIEEELAQWCKEQIETLTQVIAYVNVEVEKFNDALRTDTAKHEEDVRLASEVADSINETLAE